MQVLIPEPGSQPNMKLGLPIGPGTATAIVLDQKKVTRLPNPYLNCTTQKTLGAIDEVTSYTKALYVNLYDCVDVCIQKQYLQECGCISNNYQFTNIQLREANFLVCGNISIVTGTTSFNWQGIDETLCALSVEEDQNACESTCLTPCQELQYPLETNPAPWPHLSSQWLVYTKFIRGQSRFGSIFSEYENIFNLTKLIRDRVLLLKLDKEGLLRDNFLQLNI